MKRYYVNYRDEFTLVVDAQNEEEALDIAETATHGWELQTTLHRDFLEVIEE